MNQNKIAKRNECVSFYLCVTFSTITLKKRIIVLPESEISEMLGQSD